MSDRDDQAPFIWDEFAENPEPRCPCLLLLDVSSSMRGEPIAALNRGVAAFREELLSDALVARRVEVALVTFGPVRVQNDFQTAHVFVPPILHASGDTAYSAAIERGLGLLTHRIAAYPRRDIPHYQPFILLITAGTPTDHWRTAATLVREGEATKAFSFFAVGVREAGMATLHALAVRRPWQLDGLRFLDLFRWLARSLSALARSNLGETVLLADPAGPHGWVSAN